MSNTFSRILRQKVKVAVPIGLVLWLRANGDYIIVVYEEVGEDLIYPVTAYEVPEP